MQTMFEACLPSSLDSSQPWRRVRIELGEYEGETCWHAIVDGPRGPWSARIDYGKPADLLRALWREAGNGLVRVGYPARVGVELDLVVAATCDEACAGDYVEALHPDDICTPCLVSEVFAPTVEPAIENREGGDVDVQGELAASVYRWREQRGPAYAAQCCSVCGWSPTLAHIVRLSGELDDK